MLVLPGDSVTVENKPGPGLAERRGKVIPVVAGDLNEASAATFIESNYKRYTPARGDVVVGVISQRGGESFRVSLQPQSKPVRLNQYAFENANRKNRPNLAVGDVVYARVSAATTDMEAEIECVDPSTGKAAGFGQLKNGTVITVKLGFARHLLFHGHRVLDAIGNVYAYELAIGLNGRIWVNGPDTTTTLKICQWLVQAQDMAPEAATRLVRKA